MINKKCLAHLHAHSHEFQAALPFPHVCIDGFLEQNYFDQLRTEFPSLDYFEKHENIQRGRNQNPHNRYYLAYNQSIYHSDEVAVAEKGIIDNNKLSKNWQAFLNYLQGEDYLNLLTTLLGQRPAKIRFAWHCTATGESVSPHVDGRRKLATHSFYFNTQDDWDPSWGGQAWILGAPQETPSKVDHFAVKIPVPMLDNKSMLFQRSSQSWHAVKPLESPPDVLRKAFFAIALK